MGPPKYTDNSLAFRQIIRVVLAPKLWQTVIEKPTLLAPAPLYIPGILQTLSRPLPNPNPKPETAHPCDNTRSAPKKREAEHLAGKQLGCRMS